MVHVILVGVVVVAAHHTLDVAGLGVNDDHAHVQAVERKRVELRAHGLLGQPAAWMGSRVVLTAATALRITSVGELLLKRLHYVGDKVGL